MHTPKELKRRTYPPTAFIAVIKKLKRQEKSKYPLKNVQTKYYMCIYVWWNTAIKGDSVDEFDGYYAK